MSRMKIFGSELQVTASRCRCGHEWVPRNKGERPRICPKCKSPNWDRPRKIPSSRIMRVKPKEQSLRQVKAVGELTCSRCQTKCLEIWNHSKMVVWLPCPVCNQEAIELWKETHKIPQEGGCGRVMDYAEYRKVVGKCETCGADMAYHPKCDACGSLAGMGHEVSGLTNCDGHGLCPACQTSWQSYVKKKRTWRQWTHRERLKCEKK